MEADQIKQSKTFTGWSEFSLKDPFSLTPLFARQGEELPVCVQMKGPSGISLNPDTQHIDTL